MKFFLLILKNVRRNALRSLLTVLGTMVLVFVVTLVWSILKFLDQQTTEQSADFKVIVTERWRIPSQMPISYSSTLVEGAARNPGDARPLDSMAWQFYIGTLDPNNAALDNRMFAIGLDPTKIASMVDELDSLPPGKTAELLAAAKKLAETRQGLLVGPERLEKINKRVGERIRLYGINYRDIDLEFEIVGVLPDSRYNNSAFFNGEYLNQELDKFPLTHAGKKHELAERSLNLVWLKVPDADAFNRVADQIAKSPNYSAPAVKCETAASGRAVFLESYRDLIWGMRWLLAPAILLTLSLVIANAISISVRQRRTELAVLKVLGFRPNQLLALVLGEALLLGVGAGLVSAGLTYFFVNHVMGGMSFPIAFFSIFFIPGVALWWGVGVGLATALVGSLVPAWSARSVKVSEVFAKVA